MSGDGSERTPESTDDPTDGGTFLLGEGGLETVEEDAFGHRAHVRTLEDIVNRVETPWHVALYGTWGSGKSTIIDLLYKRIRASQESVSAYADVDTENIATRNDFENTLCVKFNAWKHAEDSIRTELLLDLNESLQVELDRRFGERADEQSQSTPSSAATDGNREELYDRQKGILGPEKIVDILYNAKQHEAKEKKPWREAIREVDPLFRWTLPVFVLALLVAGVLSFSNVSIPFLSEVVTIVLGLGAAFFALGFGSAYLNSALDEIREARRNVDKTLANPQNEWSGAYENLFNAIIAGVDTQYNERQASDTPSDVDRIIITVDDLDRCQSQTAYEILIALKSFLSHPKCIYIIPCDEDALYKHLEAADEGEYLGDTVNQQNFLAKFFETELEIPAASARRLNEYFERRCAEIDRSFDERSLEVLKDANLNTPRRITRALNRLAVLEELGHNRGVVSEVGATAAEQTDDPTPAEGDEQESDSTTSTTDTESTTVDAQTDTAEWDSERAFLALVSILQNDYPRFHAELERDPDLLNEVFAELSGGFSTAEHQGLDPLLEEIGVPEERRDSLLAFLNESRDVAQSIESPEPYLRLSSESPSIPDIFQARFDRNRVESLRALISEQRKIIQDAETEGKSGQKASPIQDDELESVNSDLLQCVNYVERKVRDETTQYNALPTAIGIADAFSDEHQGRIADAVLAALKDERPGDLLQDIELAAMEPVLAALPDRTELLRLYIQSIIDEEGLRTENFASLIDGPDKPFENQRLQEEFRETIQSARRRNTLSDEEFGEVLAEVRGKKRELYTPELVRCK